MIPARLVFDEHAGDYDTWFDEHNARMLAPSEVLELVSEGKKRRI